MGAGGGRGNYWSYCVLLWRTDVSWLAPKEAVKSLGSSLWCATWRRKAWGGVGGGTDHFALLGKLSTVLFRGMDNVCSRPEAPTGNRWDWKQSLFICCSKALTKGEGQYLSNKASFIHSVAFLYLMLCFLILTSVPLIFSFILLFPLHLAAQYNVILAHQEMQKWHLQ